MKPLNEIPVFLRVLIYWYVFVFLTIQLLSLFSILSGRFIILTNLFFWLWIFYYFRLKVFSLVYLSKVNVAIAILLVLTFIQGVSSAPNTTDSMVYHLPRVMYWIQQNSVFQDQIYNSHDYMAPFGEYIVTHLYLLFNSDRFLFFSQWLAYLGTIVVSGEIAKLLGGSKKIIQSAYFLVATLPMALMQSVSTQTDMVTSFLLILSFYFALLFWVNGKWKFLLLFSLAFGLGVLTKITFVFYGLIPAILVLFAILNIKENIANKITYMLLSALVLLIINFQFYNQNLKLFGSVVGYQTGEFGNLVLINEIMSPAELFSNLVRNIFIQIPVPFLSDLLTQFLTKAHLAFGLDINDPRTTWYGTHFKVNGIIYPQEDLAANTIQFLLFIISGLFVYQQRNKLQKNLYILTLVSFALFSLVIKWQPWHSRLHLPLMVVMTILGVVILHRKVFFLNVCISISYILALLVVLFNYSRPFISYYPLMNLVNGLTYEETTLPESIFVRSRTDQYFNPRPYWNNAYDRITSSITSNPKIKIITLDLFDDYQYPLWYFLKQKDPSLKIVSKNEKDVNYFLYTSKVFNHSLNNLECIKSEEDYGYICIGEKRS